MAHGQADGCTRHRRARVLAVVWVSPFSSVRILRPLSLSIVGLHALGCSGLVVVVMMMMMTSFSPLEASRSDTDADALSTLLTFCL